LMKQFKSSHLRAIFSSQEKDLSRRYNCFLNMNKKQLKQRLENQHRQALSIMNPLLGTDVEPTAIRLTKSPKGVNGYIEFDRKKKPVQMSIILLDRLSDIKSFYELQVTNLHETGHYLHFTANPNHLEKYLGVSDEAEKNAEKREEMLKLRALNEIVAEYFALYSLEETDQRPIYSVNNEKLISCLVHGIFNHFSDKRTRASFLRGLMLNDYEQAVQQFGREAFSHVARMYIEEVTRERELIEYVRDNLEDILTEAAAKAKTT